MNKERNAEDKSLLLAAENAECMSHRLRNKAQTLRNLSNNAKTWESDLKRASENLKVKIDTQARAKTPVIHISPAPGKTHNTILVGNIKTLRRPFRQNSKYHKINVQVIIIAH